MSKNEEYEKEQYTNVNKRGDYHEDDSKSCDYNKLDNEYIPVRNTTVPKLDLSTVTPESLPTNIIRRGTSTK